MCIRDRLNPILLQAGGDQGLIESLQRTSDAIGGAAQNANRCLLYTSDAADERSSVDLGGRRIIKKKNT